MSLCHIVEHIYHKLWKIINNVNRYVIAPNREITDSINTSYVDNYVYTKTTFNNPMYNTDLEDEEMKLKYFFEKIIHTIEENF